MKRIFILVMISIIIIFYTTNISAVELYGVFVGISNYEGGWYGSLGRADDDAQDMRYYLITEQGWDSDNTVLRIDSQATEEEILSLISSMPRSSGNTCMFFYAGHGSNPEGISCWEQYTYITPSELQSEFGSTYNQYCCFIDACRSGYMSRNMTKGVICAACGPAESASEYEGIEHGVYTYYLLQGLEDSAADASGIVSAEELHDYAAPLVQDFMNDGQNPEKNDNYSGNLDLSLIIIYHNGIEDKRYTTLYDAITDAQANSDLWVYDDAEVKSGETLTAWTKINNVKFATGKKLNVEGTLNPKDTGGGGGQYIKFTKKDASNWGGIYIKSSGRLQIEATTTVEYATTGIHVSNDEYSIGNSSYKSYVKNCSLVGMYVDNCHPTIQYLEFENCGTETDIRRYAIRVGASSSDPTIDHVTIKGSSTQYGLNVVSFADANFQNSKITDVINDKIRIEQYSDINIDQKHNDIYPDPDNNWENDWAVYLTTNSSDISVRQNYWDSASPDSSDLFYPLNKITQWREIDTSANDAGAGKIAAPELASEINPLNSALEYEKYGDWISALTTYNNILLVSHDPWVKRKAIKGIYRVNQRNRLSYDDLRATIRDELTTSASWYSAFLDYMLCEILVREKRYHEAIEAFYTSAKRYKDTSMEVEMLSRIATIYEYFLDDKDQAKVLADRAATINPGQITLIGAYAAAGITYDPQQYEDIYYNVVENFDSQPEDKPSPEASIEYLEFSPNPFNPVTTITYSIKKSSPVSIEVFAVNGQKVTTLVDGTIEAGTHSVRFDATNLASGVYFYRFRSPDFNKTGKMLLVR